MTGAEKDRALAMLTEWAEFYDRAPSPAAMAMTVNELADLTLAEFQAAGRAHLNDPERCAFWPRPGDFRRQLQIAATRDGRPTADEAWSQCPRDESDSVIWTEDMAQAHGLVADMTDQVAARRSFIDAYNRIVQAARLARLPVRWIASMGDDPGRRDGALEAAYRAGKIEPELLLAHASDGLRDRLANDPVSSRAALGRNLPALPAPDAQADEVLAEDGLPPMDPATAEANLAVIRHAIEAGAQAMRADQGEP